MATKQIDTEIDFETSLAVCQIADALRDVGYTAGDAVGLFLPVEGDLIEIITLDSEPSRPVGADDWYVTTSGQVTPFGAAQSLCLQVRRLIAA